MTKKLLVAAMAAVMAMGMTAVADEAILEGDPVTTKVGLITMDQMDVHWVRLHDAAEAKVNELNEAGNNIELEWLAPETKDNAQQIEKLNAAISDGCNYIIIACTNTFRNTGS